VLIFNIQMQTSVHIASWRETSNWFNAEAHCILLVYSKIQTRNMMASYHEGPHFDVMSAQESYQGFDAYGQPLGWYDSEGQLLSQSFQDSAETFQDIDGATSAGM
jgi:hypothetical protein